MNYLDVYFSRINYFGETQADRIKNSGIVSFEKWLAQSPFTITNLSVERGLYFSGIIQTSKDREEKKLMYLYVANDIPIVVGDILTWQQDDGTIEKWLLLQKIHKVHGTYQTFQIVQCNYEVKWIDCGRLKKSWAYTVSSVDDKVKANFRMWHNLVSPQPNKYAEIIMPYNKVDRSTNFIIEDEGWKMIEADFTSVSGIIYMSLTESKVNFQYDDLNVDVADIDKLNFPSIAPIGRVGETILPDFTDTTLNEWELELSSSDTSVISEDMVAVAPGMATITMQLRGHDAVRKYFEVRIEDVSNDFTAYIAGADSVRLDRQASYLLEGTTPITTGVHFEIDKPELAELVILEDNLCLIHANNKNKLGAIVLSATYRDITYTKTINIVPLW